MFFLLRTTRILLAGTYNPDRYPRTNFSSLIEERSNAIDRWKSMLNTFSIAFPRGTSGCHFVVVKEASQDEAPTKTTWILWAKDMDGKSCTTSILQEPDTSSKGTRTTREHLKVYYRIITFQVNIINVPHTQIMNTSSGCAHGNIQHSASLYNMSYWGQLCKEWNARRQWYNGVQQDKNEEKHRHLISVVKGDAQPNINDPPKHKTFDWAVRPWVPGI